MGPESTAVALGILGPGAGLGLGTLTASPSLPGHGQPRCCLTPTFAVPSPGPGSPAHPVPQVGGWGLPVQLREGLEPTPQVSVEQLCLCSQLVRNHLPVTAQQRPALHVHVLWAHGRGIELNTQGAPAGGTGPLPDVKPRPVWVPLPAHLTAGVGRAPAALSGPEAEAAGAAFGVGGIEGEGPEAALVTPWALHVLLGAGGQDGSVGRALHSPTRSASSPLTHGPPLPTLSGKPQGPAGPSPCSGTGL